MALEFPPSGSPPEPPPPGQPPFNEPPAYEPPPPPEYPSGAQAYPVPEMGPRRNNRTWVIVLVIVLLLCCCCLAFAFFMYRWGGDAIIHWFQQNLQNIQGLIPAPAI